MLHNNRGDIADELRPSIHFGETVRLGYSFSLFGPSFSNGLKHFKNRAVLQDNRGDLVDELREDHVARAPRDRQQVQDDHHHQPRGVPTTTPSSPPTILRARRIPTMKSN